MATSIAVAGEVADPEEAEEEQPREVVVLREAAGEEMPGEARKP